MGGKESFALAPRHRPPWLRGRYLDPRSCRQVSESGTAAVSLPRGLRTGLAGTAGSPVVEKGCPQLSLCWATRSKLSLWGAVKDTSSGRRSETATLESLSSPTTCTQEKGLGAKCPAVWP